VCVKGVCERDITVILNISFPAWQWGTLSVIGDPAGVEATLPIKITLAKLGWFYPFLLTKPRRPARMNDHKTLKNAAAVQTCCYHWQKVAPANALFCLKCPSVVSCRVVSSGLSLGGLWKTFRLPRGTKQKASPFPSHDHLTETSPLISLATTFPSPIVFTVRLWKEKERISP
jgi:hypothetical protein